MGAPERAIRWTTTLSVIALAIIAAIVSYKHMYLLVRRYGEASWTAALLPVSVDGMIVASSMSLLLDSRCGRRSGFLPWTLLIVGSTASLAANVAVAEPSEVGRLIAGWPSCALIGSYELLMRQIRHASARVRALESTYGAQGPQMYHTGAKVKTGRVRLPSAAPAVFTDGSPTEPAISHEHSHAPHTDGVRNLVRPSDGRRRGQGDGARRAHILSTARNGGRDVDLHEQAWQWAMANRTPQGDLPSGKAIAREFGRSERWGRLVKQAGTAGEFERESVAQI